MKQTLKILLFCFLTNNIIGQIKINGNVNFPPQNYESKIFDKTKQNIYYNYTYTPNPKEKNKSKTSITVLQVGKKYLKFSDIFLLKNDSLDNQFSLLKKLGIKELKLSIFTKSKIIFKKSVIKNLSNDSIKVQGIVHSTKYEYTEKAPKLNWELGKDSKSILNYNVKKATVNYSGKNWVAWYTEEIPINSGPYIFGNLPGLILELYDNKKSFHFKAIGMNNKQKEIYQRIEKSIIEISKKEFFKLERNFHQKPELFAQGKIKGGTSLRKIPYSPIEIIE